MNSGIIDLTLPREGVAKTDFSYNALGRYVRSHRLNFSVNAICLSGQVKFLINTTEYEMGVNDMVTLFVGAVVTIRHISPDVRLAIVCFSPEIMNRVNPLSVTGDLFPIIIDRPLLSLKKESALYFKDYFSLLERVDCNQSLEACAELAVCSYNSILVSTQLVYRSHTMKTKSTTRKEEICSQLIELVSKNYIKQRRAQFYADELGISLQHLSTTVKVVTGKNVLDIIAYVVIMDAKSKLKNTSMTIQEVAFSLNFPSASFFGKYFRRYVGLTPLEYRKG